MQLLALERAVEIAIAAEPAQVEERGPGGVVVGGEPVACLEVADAVADLEPEIPERVEEPLARGLHEGVRLPGAVQDEQVQIAPRRELAPAVPAERDEGDGRDRVLCLGGRAGALPEHRDDPVHRRALQAHHGVTAAARAVHVLDEPVLRREIRLRIAGERRELLQPRLELEGRRDRQARVDVGLAHPANIAGRALDARRRALHLTAATRASLRANAVTARVIPAATSS